MSLSLRGGTNGLNVWRINADGSEPLRISFGDEDFPPFCSVDHKLVYYMGMLSNKVYRMPLDGSAKPEPVLSWPTGYTADLGVNQGVGLSPDGKTLVAALRNKRDDSIHLAFFDVASSALMKMLDVKDIVSGIQYAPDGKGIVYGLRRNGADNLWLQPLNGSAGHFITRFKYGQLWSFRLSPDGKKLAILRGETDSDVVLLRDTTQR